MEVIYILTETDHDGFEWKKEFYRNYVNAENALNSIVKNYERMGRPLKKRAARIGHKHFENDFAIVRLTLELTRD